LLVFVFMEVFTAWGLRLYLVFKKSKVAYSCQMSEGHWPLIFRFSPCFKLYASWPAGD